jgi:DNA-binding Lrp family transcriptional regulator
LKKEGIIEKFTVKLNNKLVGENFIVFMFIKTKPSALLGKEVIGSKFVREVFGITGEYDLLLKLKFKDVVEFNDYIINFRKRQDIESTLTMVVTADIKEEL